MNTKKIKIFGKSFTVEDKDLVDPKLFDIKAIQTKPCCSKKTIWISCISTTVILVVITVVASLIPSFIGSPKQVCITQCKNGASCIINSDKTEKCVCSPGYYGTNYDICQTNPCSVAKSICVTSDQNKTAYRCTCGSNYPSDMCKNNAVCYLSNSSSFECKCQNGYQNRYCEDYDSCWNKPCEGCSPKGKNSKEFNCLCGSKFRDSECKLNGTYSQIRSLAQLKNGKLVAGCDNNQIKIWKDYSFTDPAVLEAHNDSVNALAVLSDDILISGSCDSNIMLWNLTTLNLTKTMRGHSDCVNSIILISKSLLLSGSSDLTVKLWDLINMNTTLTVNIDSIVLSLAYDPLTRILAVGTQQSAIRLFNVTETGTVNLITIDSLFGHGNMIWALCFLNNSILISGSADQTIKIWKMENNAFKLKQTLTDHTGDIISLISIDNGFISGSSDKTIRTWDYNWKNIYILNEHLGDINALLILNGSFLVSGSSDTTIKVRTINSNYILKSTFNYTYSIQDVVELKDQSLAACSGDNNVIIWSRLSSFNTLLIGHKNYVYSIVVLSDSTFATGSKDSSIKIWSVNNVGPIKTLFGHKSSVISLAVLPSKTLASGSCDKTIKIWALSSFTLITTIFAHSDCVNSLVAYSDNIFLSASSDKSIKVWELSLTQNYGSTNNATINPYQTTSYYNYSTSYYNYGFTTTPQSYSTSHANNYVSENYANGRSLRSLHGVSRILSDSSMALSSSKNSSTTSLSTLKYTLQGHKSSINVLSVRNKTIFSGSSDGVIISWEELLTTSIPSTFNDTVLSLIYLQDGNIAISFYNSYEIKVWNKTNFTDIKVLVGHNRNVYAMVVLMNGNLVTGSADGKIIIWENNTFKISKTLTGHTDRINGFAVLTNGYLVSSSNMALKIWNNESELVKDITNTDYGDYGDYSNFYKLTVLKDGNLVSSGDKIIIYNKTTYEKIQTINYYSFIYQVITLENENLATTVENDIVIWDMKTYQSTNVLSKHTSLINAIDKLRNGNIISCSVDSLIIIWDKDTFEPIETLSIHTMSVNAIAVDKNGNVASGSSDKTVRIWNLNTGFKLAKTLPSQKDSINTLLFLDNGNLLTGSKDGSLTVLDSFFNKMFSFSAHSNAVLALKLLSNGDLVTTSEDKTIKIWSSSIYSSTKTIE